MKKLRAVITADIVNSTLMPPKMLEKLQRVLKINLKELNADHIFYGGDSFNALCNAPEGLKIACLLRTLAVQFSNENSGAAVDIRMTIGIGSINEPFKNLSTAQGEAFVLSGREMDLMEKTGPRLSIRSNDPIIDAGMTAVALFTDFILRKLTVRQSMVLFELLKGATQVEIAQNFKKSQSTIHKHAKAANYKELMRVMEIYTRIIREMKVQAVGSAPSSG